MVVHTIRAIAVIDQWKYHVFSFYIILVDFFSYRFKFNIGPILIFLIHSPLGRFNN